MSDVEGSEKLTTSEESGSGDQSSDDEEEQQQGGDGDSDQDQESGPLRPHELIPAHIKDKGKIEVRKALMKSAANELGSRRQQLQGEAFSQEVLCSKFMKRKTLYCCTADPDKPDRRPLRPLDILCEAKVSAAARVFIKCSCEACTGGAAGYTGGAFSSVGEFAAHGKEVFGPNTIVVMAETELSWPEVLDLLRLDPCDHMWYCLFCEEDLPGAPLRTCDACQLACHGACYTRTYGQPLAAQGADERVLCLSCQDPQLQTLQEIQQVKLGSKAGTARYTVPLMAHEVFRRETNPSHFEKGTYDFWGKNQAHLMDPLVFPVDSPEAQAAAAAVAAAAAAAAGGRKAGDKDGAAAAAAGGKGAAAAATGDEEDEQNADKAAAGEDGEGEEEQQRTATHVLIVRDPSGQILTVDYEFGKWHKTHGKNRKLWVIPLLEHLQMQLGDLLIATREPLKQQQRGKKDAEPWRAVLDKCDKVLQLHIVRKKHPAAQDNATSRAAALKAANAAAQAARSAIAAGRGGAGAAAAAASKHAERSGRTARASETGSADKESGGGTPAPAVVQAAPAGISLFNAVATTRPGQGRRGAAAAFSAAAEAIAAEVMTKPAYKVVQAQREQQQQYLRQLEEEQRHQEQLRLQQQLLQRKLQEKFAEEEAARAPLLQQQQGVPQQQQQQQRQQEDGGSDTPMSDVEADPGEVGDDDFVVAGAGRGRGRGRPRGRPRGSRGRGRGRGAGREVAGEVGPDGVEAPAGQKRRRRSRKELQGFAGSTAGSGEEGEGAGERPEVGSRSAGAGGAAKRQRKAGSSNAGAAAAPGQGQGLGQGQHAGDGDMTSDDNGERPEGGSREDLTSLAAKIKSGLKRRLSAPQSQAAAAAAAAGDGEGGAAAPDAAGAGATAAAGAGTSGAGAQQLETANTQLQQELAAARQQIQTLQRQLDQAAEQRGRLEKARFEAVQQRDAAAAERDKSQAQCRALLKEQQEVKAMLKDLQQDLGTDD